MLFLFVADEPELILSIDPRHCYEQDVLFSTFRYKYQPSIDVGYVAFS